MEDQKTEKAPEVPKAPGCGACARRKAELAAKAALEAQQSVVSPNAITLDVAPTVSTDQTK